MHDVNSTFIDLPLRVLIKRHNHSKVCYNYYIFYYSGYDPSDYDHLQIGDEVKDLFQYITRYTPQSISLETRMMPFIPDYVPAIGDIDAFLKVRYQ